MRVQPVSGASILAALGIVGCRYQQAILKRTLNASLASYRSLLLLGYQAGLEASACQADHSQVRRKITLGPLYLPGELNWTVGLAIQRPKYAHQKRSQIFPRDYCPELGDDCRQGGLHLDAVPGR